MSELNIKEDGSRFASSMSAIFTSGFTTSTLDGFEINYSFIISSFDIIPALISFIIFSLFFYPFNQFFGWLYSATPKNKT
ncbi:MAG: hypothetical protein MJK15_09480 [Colwellia sp.]|nr:hypothetical protein [Colwellia sp.]